MTPGTDGFPLVGRSARQLGVRTLDSEPHNDVNAVMPGDRVSPGEGMSAAPENPTNLPKNRRPPQLLGGIGKDPVWEIDSDELGPALEFFQDKPTHGVLAAKVPMTLDEL